MEIDTRKLIWWQIEQDLTKRRQNIERQLSKHLEANSDTILETLFSELEKSKDVKTWWNQDMPKLLQDELHSSVSQLSISINQSIVNDLKWLQEELEQKLNYSFEVYVEPGISVNENKPVQKDLLLSNNNQFKIITKIGTIAIAVTAGAMLITSTPIALATGAITGIVAEKLINSNIVKDKEKVRSELKVIISKTILEYTSTFSQKLRIKYDQINENLKTHSIIWQQTQLQALNAVEQRNQHGKEVDFNDILKKINTLSEDIRKHFYTYSISEL